MYPIEKYTFKIFDKINEDGSKSKVVIALTTYCGKVVKGVAKCIEGDWFSLETGKELAAARCDFKVCNKRLNKARKKKHEIAMQIEALNKDYADTNSYYEDTLATAYRALEHLKNLENSLK